MSMWEEVMVRVRHRRRRSLVALFLISTVGFLAACAGPETTPPADPVPEMETATPEDSGACGPTTSSDQLEPLAIAVAGNLTFTPYVLWGMKNGCYEKHGLDVSLVTTGAAVTDMVAAMTGGSADIAGDGNFEVVLAYLSSSDSIRIVAGGYEFSAEELAAARTPELVDGKLILQTALIVRPDLELTSISDLAGTTLAVNQGLSNNTMGLRQAIVQAGVDLDEVNLVPLGREERLDAFERGDVDGLIANGQDAYRALAVGGKVALYPGAYIYQPGAVTAWFTLGSIAEEKAEQISAFRLATQEIHTLLNDPAQWEGFKTFLIEDYELAPETVQNFVMPSFVTRDLTFQEFQYAVDALLVEGAIDEGRTLGPEILFSQ